MLIGIVFVCIPFLGSLKPPANAGELLPHVDVREMKVDTYTIFTHTVDDWMGISYLIIRNAPDDFDVYLLPNRNGKFVMPDLSWYRLGGLCSEFGPDLINGKTSKDSLIRCQDVDLEEWQVKEWSWTRHGKKLGRWTADMIPIKYKKIGKHIVLERE
ncbi:hypothetical protein Misp06_00003 [Microbulbifer sp. NBRC 101763]